MTFAPVHRPAMNPRWRFSFLVMTVAWAALLVPLAVTSRALAQKPAEQELAALKAPPGFDISLFASEPMIKNPTCFTFDDRGRMWVCESYEYPRREPAPGRDRIQILEDTDGDGRAG